MSDENTDLPLPPEPAPAASGQWTQPPPPGMAGPSAGNTFVDNLIPTKNAYALTSYYLGVFSVIPCLAFLLGTAALILGVMGLNNIKRDPRLPGKAHAWVGIIAGGFFLLLNIAVVIFVFVLGMSRSR